VKVVLSWLREFCPTDLSAGELAELLTHKGAEVESIERPWERLSGVVVARVMEVRDHPNSEKLCVVRVQAGAGELEVVAGIRNMKPGDLVPLAPPGATVPALPEPLAARSLRGVVSNGMLCSPMELGIAPTHDGIMILPEGFEPGQDLKSALGLDDAVLDVEVTPNRPDFLSVIGVAREVAAATGVPFTMPEPVLEEDGEKAADVATVEIVDLDRCPRYLARVIRSAKDAPSPLRIQARLSAAGMRPISAIVDATNYAMLEIGQPLHAFDLALLTGPGIVVRRAHDGERLITLDDEERVLSGDDLLICDLERPVALAGVMGGRVAEVSGSTTDILLESASFERGGVQRTRRRIGLSTEASMRFERGVDPEAAPAGADRACALMQGWMGGSVLAGVAEAGSVGPRRRVSMRSSRATALIGYEVTPAAAHEVFDRLGFASEAEGDVVTVEVPGYRVDIEREVDLIEEVVRVQGYERVGSTLPPVRQAGGLPVSAEFRRRIRSSMMRAGLREVRPIPFVSQADLSLTGDDDAVRVTNPLAADDAWLRTRLTPGLLKVLVRNASRQVRGAAVFEVGTVFRLVDGRPDERPKVAAAMTGAADLGWTSGGRTFDVFDAKGALESVLVALSVPWGLGGPIEGGPFHPGRSAWVEVGGERAGVLGELHPSIASRMDLPERVALFELEVNALQRHAGTAAPPGEIPRFPPVRRDLAFVVASDTPAEAVGAALVEAGGSLIGECVLFDVHEGPPLPEGKKSLGFSVDFRAPDRTLEGDEANEAVERIAGRLANEFGAELRSG
jgi:phenylalanyl-tRNA synthetase beta chain